MLQFSEYQSGENAVRFLSVLNKIDCSKFLFKSGRNATHFCPGFFQRKVKDWRSSKFWKLVSKPREKLPNFVQDILKEFQVVNFRVQIWTTEQEKMLSIFIQESFKISPHSIVHCLGSRQEKCCPTIIIIYVQKIVPGYHFSAQNIKQGKMLPIFQNLPTCCSKMSVQIRGKSCPFLFNEGEMLPIFIQYFSEACDRRHWGKRYQFVFKQFIVEPLPWNIVLVGSCSCFVLCFCLVLFRI